MHTILTHGYYILEDEKEQTIMKPYPPLGILYIAAYLENHGESCSVFDTTFAYKKDLIPHLEEQQPSIIAIYTNLMTKVNVIESIQKIRDTPTLSESIIVLGGPDLRHNIPDYLNTGADILVIGEGEQTMLEIIRTVQQGNRSEYAHIDGLAYRSDGEIIKTKERSRIRPVDDLPFPAREKIDMQPYLETWKTHHGKSAMTVSTQRGCPYTCKWCSTAVYGQSYRRRSPEIVASELKYLKDNYQPDSIWFVDDVFTVSHKWLEGFVEEVISQDAVIPFECISRADRMNEDVVDLLKQAGCFRVWIGAESGSQRVIDLMDRRVDVNHVSDMIKLTRAKGMEAGTFIMLGYPGETEEDIIKTVNYLKDCKPDQFTITVAYPIKGTSMYNEIEEDQTVELDWMKTTDRDREFKRTYSRKYYDYALRYVVNAVNANNDPMSLKKVKAKVKSWVHYTCMQLAK